MIVVMGIGTKKQDEFDFDYMYGLSLYLDENTNINTSINTKSNLNKNIFRVSSFEYYDNSDIYDKFLNIISENDKKYNKFDNSDNFYKNQKCQFNLEEKNRTKSKPIPIPKPNYS
jgi:hypothetical protein